MNDQQLMQKIHDRWASQISVIVPEELSDFVAGLIANESEGQPDATRFEPAVFRHLAHEYPDWTPDRIRENATSWGLTQIMGYHVVGDPHQLTVPTNALRMTVSMLSTFRARFYLKPDDWPGLFRCWNTGHPSGTTFDPEYVPNGLERMKAYAEICQSASPSPAVKA